MYTLFELLVDDDDAVDDTLVLTIDDSLEFCFRFLIIACRLIDGRSIIL